MDVLNEDLLICAGAFTMHSSNMNSSNINSSKEFAPQTGVGGTSASAPQFSIVELISSHATSTPNAIAVAMGIETLTYAELDRRANQLALHLKSLGVGRESLVGLYVKRSPAFAVAALAALKAGAAYLPLDPESPLERTAYMLTDAGVSAVVTSGDAPAEIHSGAWAVVDLNRDPAKIASESVQERQAETQAEDLAYVIYTSGSSGRPKGVEITHANLRNLIAWHNRAFQVTESDRASFLAALGFDAAVWELWPYLAAGASVHIPNADPRNDVRNDAGALRGWLLENRITISFAATPMAERLLALDWAPNATLRILLTGADTLRRRPAANLPFALVNNYGPTECTVVATSGTVTPAGTTKWPSIGRAIDNTAVYILDEAMRAVPQGEAGELYVGGANVARGYRNHPELTAQRFVRAPFATDHAILYRTGDLVRELPNGEVEFLGRADEQVKIRGFRIEPGEIIAVLNACPGVETSTVVAQGETNGEKRLIAYITAAADAVLTLGTVREHLTKLLPDYMIPAVFVELESLPVTANGKVDRNALPQPTNANMLREEAYVAPQTVIEQRLAGLIAPLLNMERVGVNDNFFLLGGHSLLGTQLITRIREAFGVDLPLLSLFDHPTLAGMSSEIEILILEKIEAANGEARDGDLNDDLNGNLNKDMQPAVSPAPESAGR
jgi:amino acid adenylation domain-containing protein